MDAATAGAHDLPAAVRAFALVKDPTSEEGEIIDER